MSSQWPERNKRLYDIVETRKEKTKLYQVACRGIRPRRTVISIRAVPHSPNIWKTRNTTLIVAYPRYGLGTSGVKITVKKRGLGSALEHSQVSSSSGVNILR